MLIYIILAKTTSTTVPHFSKIISIQNFHDPTLSGSSITPMSEIYIAAMLVLLMTRN